jgi:hypothetical protein
MANIDEVLKPKSTKEVEDLEKRGFRKNMGKWKFCITISDIILEYDKSNDLIQFKNKLLELLNNKLPDIKLYADAEEYNKFVILVKTVKELSDSLTVNDVDSIIESLYDWADENSVWIESM